MHNVTSGQPRSGMDGVAQRDVAPDDDRAWASIARQVRPLYDGALTATLPPLMMTLLEELMVEGARPLARQA